MASYEPGKMDITEQKAAYDAFIKASVRLTVLVVVVLLLMYIFLV